ncbi:hypothetical protein PTH_2024 [Pelotomaculum thermopropionicum SI]|uniref:Uncharacterized protein n=1 Tax=Pelotomaculum thermopropionicum (strain DSM 13744 / JCM 10971 / SI) TaxID=370438 RepID=A5D0N5_PELTS|nr:hypothetical protein PTH_2024 [Pelotomaculum thermopropionicum SI]
MSEKTQNGAELIRSLASTIQKKIVEPAAGRANAINLEILEINKKMEAMEKELSLLAAACRKTGLLAAAAVLGMILLAIILFVPFS